MTKKYLCSLVVEHVLIIKTIKRRKKRRERERAFLLLGMKQKRVLVHVLKTTSVNNIMRLFVEKEIRISEKVHLFQNAFTLKASIRIGRFRKAFDKKQGAVIWPKDSKEWWPPCL